MLRLPTAPNFPLESDFRALQKFYFKSLSATTMFMPYLSAV